MPQQLKSFTSFYELLDRTLWLWLWLLSSFFCALCIWNLKIVRGWNLALFFLFIFPGAIASNKRAPCSMWTSKVNFSVCRAQKSHRYQSIGKLILIACASPSSCRGERWSRNKKYHNTKKCHFWCTRYESSKIAATVDHLGVQSFQFRS